MAAISAFRVTQHSQIFHFSLEIEFNALRFINYTIPSLCSTYAVATIGVLLLIGYWCTFDWNQLAFAVPETLINLTVGRYFCYNEIDPWFLLSYVQCIQSALLYK